VKLLISPTDEKETVEAIEGGADIIDVKNPKEGALGANYPWVIRRIREITPKHLEVSCTIGDVPNLFGTVSLAALGAATTGVDYIKTGLYGLKTKEDAIHLMRNVTRAVKEYNSSIKVVATGYADAERVGSVNPLSIPEIAHKAEADLAMVDTAVKDGKNLFAFLTNTQLRRFVEEAHDYGLKVALAGSLRKEDLPTVQALGADIAGLRGAACTNGDRFHGRITRENVRELAKAIKSLETPKTLKF
jgi:uncharacterized protein (UPF0264 family)